MTARTPVDITDLEVLLLTEIEEETGATDILLSSKLTDLDVDSLSFSEIVMNLERRIGAEIDIIETFELDRDATVEDLLAAITEKLAPQGGLAAA